jgi:integration host factor subunit alpha
MVTAAAESRPCAGKRVFHTCETETRRGRDIGHLLGIFNRPGTNFLLPIQGTPPMTLTKEELVNAIAEANGYLRNRSVELVEILLELIKSKLASGEDVLISGFGKFCVMEKLQRRGRNPATGEEMMLDARRVVTFKCSGQLREKINNPQQ